MQAKLNAALLSAQANIAGAAKCASNPHFKSRYADLESILDAVKGPLNEAGIVILQPLAIVGDTWCVCTTLLHAESGESATSTMPIVSKDMADPQKWGSAITYARRYTLQSLVALPAIDDDGNTASAAPPQRTQAAPPAKDVSTNQEWKDASEKETLIQKAWAIAQAWNADASDWKAAFMGKGFESSKSAPLDYVKNLHASLDAKSGLLQNLEAHIGTPKTVLFLAERGGIMNVHLDDIRAALTDATGGTV